ncbi:hypothetical protein AB0I00_35805 [Streptomyces sp. NPDC050803]|uniref:hypothetical protein n=1 Tax=unclassified Streptomyces TaxID=2593676 RepID=UPI0034314CBC
MADPFSTFLNTSNAIRHQQNVTSSGRVSGAYSDERRRALLELLHHLSDQAEEHAQELPSPEAVRDVITEATAEAAKESPNFTLLGALLEAVRIGVGNVSPMIAVTSALQALVADLRG